MNHKSEKGFTLFEMLIYIALVSGILVVATSFAWNIINSRTKAYVTQEVQQNGRMIVSKIISETRSAVSVTNPLIGELDSQLTLVTSDGATNPTVFNLSGEDITIQKGVGDIINLNSDRIIVTGLVFENLSASNDKTRNIKISFTLEHVNPDNKIEWQFSDTFETIIELRGN